jgi:hypothetical protein
MIFSKGHKHRAAARSRLEPNSIFVSAPHIHALLSGHTHTSQAGSISQGRSGRSKSTYSLEATLAVVPGLCLAAIRGWSQAQMLARARPSTATIARACQLPRWAAAGIRECCFLLGALSPGRSATDLVADLRRCPRPRVHHTSTNSRPRVVTRVAMAKGRYEGRGAMPRS